MRRVTGATSLPCGPHRRSVARIHSNIGESLASTSSMTASGMLSSFLPPRAARSRARGWSQRTTPVVLVPSVRGTAKPAVRAKLPPLVIGRTIGSLVIRLKASGDTINTGRRPFCSCPDVGSRLTSQISPRFIRQLPYMSSPPTGLLSSHSCSCLERRAFGSHWASSSSNVYRLRRCGSTTSRPLSTAMPTLAPGCKRRTSSSAGGTASMTEPPTLRSLVVCKGVPL
jgi:hypothetical protein